LEPGTSLNDGFDDNKTNTIDADTYQYIKANQCTRWNQMLKEDGQSLAKLHANIL
jgi:hypothetical protein